MDQNVSIHILQGSRLCTSNEIIIIIIKTKDENEFYFSPATCQSSWVEIDSTGTMYSGCEVLNSSTNATLHPEIESCKDWACQQGANAINW